MTARTLRMPTACAPRSCDCRPTDARVARCHVRDRLEPTCRSIATAAMSAERRARAMGLSFRSTTWTAPEAWSLAETPSIDSMFVPFGGSSCSTGDDPFAGFEARLEPRLRRRRDRGRDDIALDDVQGDARLAPFLEGGTHRRHLCGRGAAAAADDAGAEAPRLRRELGEVVGGRVRVDEPASRARRETYVGLGGERDPVRGLAHLGERSERRLGAEPAVRADRDHPEPRQPGDRVVRVHACERLRVLVEGELGNDRQRRHVLNGPDRGLELVQVVERLHEEQVHPRPSSSRACSWNTANASSAPVVCSRSPSGPIEPPIRTGAPETSRASRASFTPRSTICSSWSSRNCAESCRSALKVLVSISSAPARMNP